jgi:pimeloyl-ACP methyl ester carboxylesterase
VDHVVDDIDALMEQLQVKQAYLVGHDWAAIVVHKLVRKYPNRVIQAMVIDPIVPGAEALYLSREHASEAWYFWFHQLDMAVALVGSSPEATKIYYSHFLSHRSYNKAHHYSEAGMPGPAVAYWRRAGERAVQRSANQEAIGT